MYWEGKCTGWTEWGRGISVQFGKECMAELITARTCGKDSSYNSWPETEILNVLNYAYMCKAGGGCMCM